MLSTVVAVAGPARCGSACLALTFHGAPWRCCLFRSDALRGFAFVFFPMAVLAFAFRLFCVYVFLYPFYLFCFRSRFVCSCICAEPRAGGGRFNVITLVAHIQFESCWVLPKLIRVLMV